MAALALNAVQMGAERIPDQAFHAVPGGYFRPPGKENPLKNFGGRKTLRKSRQDHSTDSEESQNRDKPSRGSSQQRSTATSYGSDRERGHSRRSELSSKRRRRRSSHGLDRGDDSGSLAPTQDERSLSVAGGRSEHFFPPPPLHSVDSYDAREQAGDPQHREGSPDQQQPYWQRQYSHFAQSAPSNRHNFRRDYDSSPAPEMSQDWQPRRIAVNPSYVPYADYHSSGYEGSQGAMFAEPQISSEAGYSTTVGPYVPPASDPYVADYSTYYPPTDDYVMSPSQSPARLRDRDRSRSRGGRSSRRDSRSRSRSRARSEQGRGEERKKHKQRGRSKSISSKAKQVLKSNRDLGSSALGVLAGGLAGNQLGKGNRISTIAGAVIGGFGAQFLEKQHADSKRHKERKYREAESAREKLRDNRRKEEERQQRYADRDDSYKSTRQQSRRDADQTGYRDVHEQSDVGPAETHRSRSRRPYARAAKPPASGHLKSSSTHVHFTKPDPKEYVKSATRKATSSSLSSDRTVFPVSKTFQRPNKSRDERKSSRTSKEPAKESKEETAKEESVKKEANKAMEAEVPMARAAKTIKEAVRKGTWDGTVVEEVFMEIIGVTMGEKEYMKSDWKN